MEILSHVLLAAHFVGLAAVVGVFLVQMRQDSDFGTGWLLGGAATQVVTGILLIVLRLASGGDVDWPKMITKLVIGLVALVGAILAARAQKQGGRVKPFFHAAGGMALVNVLVAVLWP